MTVHPHAAHAPVGAPFHAPSTAPDPQRASGLRLPPVRRRPTALRRPGPLFTTLEEYVDLTRQLREASTRG